MVVASRFARHSPYIVTGLGYLYASAPDFGVDALKGKWGLVGLVVFWVLSQFTIQTIIGTELSKYQSAFKSVGEIISDLSEVQDGSGKPQITRNPNESIDTLLRRAQAFAVATLRPAANCEIAAHLLLPEQGIKKGKQQIIGLRATRHDDYRPDRTHEIIPLDSPGAGHAFSYGVPSQVPDTDSSDDPRVRGKAYKSIGAFPIVVGRGEGGGKVRAVLSLDATVPNVFTKKAVSNLAPFINPIAQLIGLAMATQERREKP